MTARALTGWRLVPVQHGDTLQEIAARELNDASQWPDLISINKLVYPYLTGDPLAATNGVLLYGSFIRVPAAQSQASSVAAADQLYGVDLDLTNGILTADNGDFKLIGGVANLKQALLHRIMTPLRELMFHLRYGNGAHALLGLGNGPSTGLLAGEYVRSALNSDQRVASVPSVTAAVSGGSIAIQATVNPVNGTSIDILGTV